MICESLVIALCRGGACYLGYELEIISTVQQNCGGPLLSAHFVYGCCD